jgi:hypothetical protein
VFFREKKCEKLSSLDDYRNQRNGKRKIHHQRPARGGGEIVGKQTSISFSMLLDEANKLSPRLMINDNVLAMEEMKIPINFGFLVGGRGDE